MEPLFFNTVGEHLFRRGDRNFRCKKKTQKKEQKEGRENGEIGTGERGMRENDKMENEHSHFFCISLPQLLLFSSLVSPLDPTTGMYLTILFASICLNFMAKAVSSVFLSFSLGFSNY